MKNLADLETTPFLGAVTPVNREVACTEIVRQPGDSTDDAVHQPSARNESVPNPGARLNAARGNPSPVGGESGIRDNTCSILSKSLNDASNYL